MNSMPLKAKVFILVTCFLGSISLISQLRGLTDVRNWLMLLICCAAAAFLQVLKIEGATARTSYNLSWIVYGFAFVNLGTSSAMLVILVSHLFEWAWYRYPWYIQVFNIATFSIALLFSDLAYDTLETVGSPLSSTVLSILVAFVVLTFVNHLLVGFVVLFARNQSLIESGVMDPSAYLMDLGLLAVGALAAIVWVVDPYAMALMLLVLFLLYRALMVPSLRRRAELDPKTGVYNMTYFNAKFEEEVTRSQRLGRSLCVVMADLDHLRDINNTYGHLAGDLVINGSASILKSISRDYDVVARFGGEEFAVLMGATTVAEAQDVAELMRGAVENAAYNASSESSSIRATMSFGIAVLSPDTPLTVRELFEQADRALYEAKRLGRNRVCVFEADLPAIQLAAKAPARTGSEAAISQSSLTEADCGSRLQSGVDNVTPRGAPNVAQTGAKQGSRKWVLPAYVGGITVVVLVMSLLMARQGVEANWLGISLFIMLAFGAELANLEIYAKQTSVSTSAIPLISGAVLFGPVAALCIGPAIACAAWFKYRSPLVRVWFNANNHILGGLLCAGIVMLTGKSFEASSFPLQVVLILTCGIVLYFSSTSLVAGAIAISEWSPYIAIWLERFRWLGVHYVALAVVSYGLIVSYRMVGVPGIMVILMPLLILRYSQKQYIGHTEAMVHRLQNKNTELSQQNQEIAALNEEVLNLIAAALDLRDPAAQNHSSQVAYYAVQIAKELRLPEARMDQIRRVGLLHDIGKLAIPESILFKSTKLTQEEFAAVKQHPDIGARILGKYHSFNSLIDFVRHHHEHYDGSGYPDGLTGTNIPLEARILGLADAVEAMASERPYHRAETVEEVKRELKRCSGTQFDPEIVDAFLKVLDHHGDNIVIDSSRGSLLKESCSAALDLPHWSNQVPSFFPNTVAEDGRAA